MVLLKSSCRYCGAKVSTYLELLKEPAQNFATDGVMNISDL